MSSAALLLAFDLVGTFVFALNGALTAIKVARLDLIGVVTLGIITAVGGGVMRDLILGATPPASFQQWYYLAVAIFGGLIAFAVGHRLQRKRFLIPILILDAAGLSLFAVAGTAKALDFNMGIIPAILLGSLTAVGGGTIRDIMVGQIPTVLHSELYVVPALIAGAFVMLAHVMWWPQAPGAVIGAVLCFVIRVLGMKFRLNAPRTRRL